MRDEDFDLDEALARLPVYDAPAECVGRVRASAHASLGRLRARRAVHARLGAALQRVAASGSWSWLEPALALGLCAVYLLAAATGSFALYR